MVKTVSEAYSELWHYTAASGLQGILLSNQLWATNYRYLNDREEISGFFDRKLNLLIAEGAQRGITELSKSLKGRAALKRLGGDSQINKELPPQLSEALKNVTLLFDIFVTSFCYTKPGKDSEDGLLSQWRGYGHDGGYALVFDTQKLDELLAQERLDHEYAYVNYSDVDYHDLDDASAPKFEETLKWEEEIRQCVAEMVTSQDLRPVAERFFDPVTSLAVRHKHRGFREEAEVRIVAIPPTPEMKQEADRCGITIKNKKIDFFNRNGVLVPYLSLFEEQAKNNARLPIKKIVVGPHPEKELRKKSLQLFLEQLGLSVEVVSSDIPYLGR